MMVPPLNFKRVPGPTFKLWWGSRVPGPEFLGPEVLVPLLHHTVKSIKIFCWFYMQFILRFWFYNFHCKKKSNTSLTVAPIAYIGNKTHIWFIWYCTLYPGPILKPSTAWKPLKSSVITISAVRRKIRQTQIFWFFPKSKLTVLYSRSIFAF